MKFLILSLFPEIVENFINFSVLQKAQNNKIFQVTYQNLRDFSKLKNKKVDDNIFGGGGGMLLRPEPIFDGISWAKKKVGAKAKVIFFSPSGKKFDQNLARKFAHEKKNLILVCGKYEGFDHRVKSLCCDEEISVGDFVVSGGEIPAALFIDAIARNLPGTLGNSESLRGETFSPENCFANFSLPKFTRPKIWKNLRVPEVLSSGNHAKINDWNFENISLCKIEKKILQFRRKILPRKTRRLIFKNPEISHAKIFQKWVNDPEIIKNLIIEPGLSLADEIEFLQDATKNLKFLLVSIFEKKSKQLIGNASLQIRDNEKVGEFGILIGEKKFHALGFGTEILEEFIKIAFEDLELKKIVSRVFKENLASQKLHQKCGFSKAGFFQKDFWKKD